MAKIKSHSTDSHKTKPKTINKKAFERVYWPYIPLVLAVSLLLSLSANSGGLQAAVKHHTIGKVLSYSTSMSIGGLLADTNVQRSANGVAGLSLNDTLSAAAQANADDMAARNYWSHYTPEGNPPWIWVTNQGYAYQALGQNLATGFSDEQSTINGWMASPPHRENLLNSNFTEVGFGYANNPNYTSAGGGPQTIVVAFYGRPQVLAAQTSTPATPAATAPASPSTSNPTPSQTPASSAPSAEQPQTPAAEVAPQSTAKQAATTATPKKNITPSTNTSNLQLAAPSAAYGSAAAKLSVVLALVIIGLWANRHIRALHKFLIKGERYALRHPLTDLGVMMMAALLFILSQTAGLIQ